MFFKYVIILSTYYFRLRRSLRDMTNDVGSVMSGDSLTLKSPEDSIVTTLIYQPLVHKTNIKIQLLFTLFQYVI